VDLPTLALLMAAAGYAGFQWTIRILVYPQFGQVPPEGFARYERAHQRRAAIAVGPLFTALGLACLVALVSRPGWWTGCAGAGFAAILALTAVGAVPQHARLTTSFDPVVYRRLLAVDTARLVLAVAVLGCAVGAALADG